MNKGKRKCEILKTIRCQVAKKNGIPYTYTECTYQGECRGTCPKCEEELRYLNRELEKIKQSGKQVAVAGVATAVIATTTVGCSSDFLTDLGLKNQTTMGVPAYTQQEELDGDVAYVPPETEQYEVEGSIVYVPPGEEETEPPVETELMGDMLPPEEEIEPPLPGEVPDEYVTAGVPMPGVPFISDVIADLQQGIKVYMDSFERTTVQVEWADWLTESGDNYDVFAVDGVQIIVTYHEDGWSVSVALYAEVTAEDGQ